ncbi:MAG TPA: hypothetical protein VGD40_02515 [Chryseosolibacter sp.]
MADIKAEDFGKLLGSHCIAKLLSGEEVAGTLSAGSINNGYLGKITIKKEDGTKLKLSPDQLSSLKVKAGKAAKWTMMSESANSIQALTKADFQKIQNQEYIFFETTTRVKSEKQNLMQLLNPDFDSKIKVFPDPKAKQTKGIGLGGVQLTGGDDKSYLFVKNGEATELVKKGSYKKNFDDLYSDCPEMIKAFTGEKIKWSDVAGHVYAYDNLCKK